MSRSVRVAGTLREEGENIGLHRFALFTACSTAFLIFAGGLVTTTESGLVGGIFYEHGHRMVAAFVGFLTVVLTIWMRHTGSGLATILFALLWRQLTLGAFTVWTEKSVTITTLHIAVGALVLGTSVLLTLRAFSMVRDHPPAVVYPIREAAWQ